ncbi:MAG: M48 family metalloprotease [Candidatus Wallbacteria bacterium]
MNCPKCSVALVNTYTPKGIVVDYCPTCQGIWFDKGELNYYSKSPAEFAKKLKNGLLSPHNSEKCCPRCNVNMNEGGLIKDELLIDQCPDCEGIWLDARELTQMQLAEIEINSLEPSNFFSRSYTASNAMEELTGNKTTARNPFAAVNNSGRNEKIAMPKLPNLLMYSISTMVILYGMLGVVMILLAELEVMPTDVAVLSTLIAIVVNFLVSPFIMDIFLRWFQSMEWVGPQNLPEPLRNFISDICHKENIPFPRIGIINDGTPNAFTYGHTPSNARVVITRGLMRKLNAEELNAVIGHELGHAVHWDILIMTMASMVPILLYYISKTLMEMKSNSKNEKNPLPLIGLIAYIMYIIAQYAVLFLSRTREYSADRYSAEATGNPNALTRALIKIAYGLASETQSAEETRKNRAGANALSALGIFDASSAKCLVATSAKTTSLTADFDEEISKENIIGAMQWDLWNPWAIYYELHSSHPLPAKRIDALAKTASAMDKTPYITFDKQKPECYWDDFLVDFVIKFLPLAGLLLGGGSSLYFGSIGNPLLLFGLGMLAQTLFSYPKNSFLDHSVASLLKYVKVSDVRPVPAVIKGKIIGKGIPGLIYSEDLVLQDNSGYIFLNYEQPLAIFNFFFGLKNDKYIGTNVTVTGWYRRAPVPYFEIYKMDAFDGTSTCYIYWYKLIFSLSVAAIGFYFVIAGI